MQRLLVVFAVVLFSVALFAKAASAYKDGEDGINRTHPGSKMSVKIAGISVAGVRTSADFSALRDEAPGQIELTKDWANSMEWHRWRQNVVDGKTDRRTVSIIFLDAAGAEVDRVNFYNCWPVKHTLPSADAESSGHTTETIELAYERLEWGE
jgi:phage tail-like protein